MKYSLPFLLLIAAGFATANSPVVVYQDDSQFESDSTKLITECGNNQDLLSIDYINLKPDPPVKGQTLEIDFKGYLKEEVPEGTIADITVKFGVVQLIKKKFDFCTEVQKINETCPIPAGDLSIQKSIDLPKEIPPGKYTVRAVIVTPDDKEVTCLMGQTTFRRFF